MADKKKKEEEPGFIQGLINRYFPPAAAAKQLKDKLDGPKRKPETEEQRKQRLMRQAILGAGAKK